jgi:hypothetical protein
VKHFGTIAIERTHIRKARKLSFGRNHLAGSGRGGVVALTQEENEYGHCRIARIGVEDRVTGATKDGGKWPPPPTALPASKICFIEPDVFQDRQVVKTST